jgi:hypothetical protein
MYLYEIIPGAPDERDLGEIAVRVAALKLGIHQPKLFFFDGPTANGELSAPMRIPNQIGHPFRRKSATCSEANRPGLRSKSATPLGVG